MRRKAVSRLIWRLMRRLAYASGWICAWLLTYRGDICMILGVWGGDSYLRHRSCIWFKQKSIEMWCERNLSSVDVASTRLAWFVQCATWFVGQCNYCVRFLAGSCQSVPTSVCLSGVYESSLDPAKYHLRPICFLFCLIWTIIIGWYDRFSLFFARSFKSAPILACLFSMYDSLLDREEYYLRPICCLFYSMRAIICWMMRSFLAEIGTGWKDRASMLVVALHHARIFILWRL